MKIPLILDYAIPRKSEAKRKYDYDNELNLNVMNVNGEKIPFIDYDTKSLELHTKTEIEGEEDESSDFGLELNSDSSVSFIKGRKNLNELLELLTKTKVRNEGDDE